MNNDVRARGGSFEITWFAETGHVTMLVKKLSLITRPSRKLPCRILRPDLSIENELFAREKKEKDQALFAKLLLNGQTIRQFWIIIRAYIGDIIIPLFATENFTRRHWYYIVNIRYKSSVAWLIAAKQSLNKELNNRCSLRGVVVMNFDERWSNTRRNREKKGMKRSSDDFDSRYELIDSNIMKRMSTMNWERYIRESERMEGDALSFNRSSIENRRWFAIRLNTRYRNDAR